MSAYTITDPRSVGRAASIGSFVLFVDAGIITPLYKFGALDTNWEVSPDHSTTPVTSDPRIDGLSKTVDTMVWYTASGIGKWLIKYGTGNTEWAVWTPAVAQAQLEALTGCVRGAVLYRGASGWVALTPGDATKVLTSNGTGADPSWAAAGGGGVADGDKGDITVSGVGTVWTVDASAVTYAKIQNVSATDKVLGRSTAGAGSIEEIICTAAGRALIDDADAAAQRATLGLGALALLATVGTGQIDINAATNAKLAQMAQSTIKGRAAAAGAGDPVDLTAAQTKTLLAIAAGDVSGLATVATSGSAADLGAGALPAGRMPALTGDVTTVAGAVATTIGAQAVTLAKLVNASATARILARKTAGAGSYEEVTTSDVLDFLSTTHGSLLYRGVGSWSGLAPGTATHVLTSNGAGADPTWAAAGAGPSLGLVTALAIAPALR